LKSTSWSGNAGALDDGEKMTKRWPVLASFLLFILLCATLAYWAMQWFRPPTRPVAPPPVAANVAPPLQAASSLFGGRSGPVAVASNYELRGVVVSGKPGESIAILSANGKPAQYVVANAEVSPGVTVKEVHRQYIVLSDGGVNKRVELPTDAKMAGAPGTPDMSRVPGATSPVSARTASAMPTTVVSPPNASPPGGVPASAPNFPQMQPGMPQPPAAVSDQTGTNMSGASSAATTTSGGAQRAPQSVQQPAQQPNSTQGGAVSAQPPAIGSRATNGARAAQPNAIQQPYQPFSTQPRQ
jgi:general secretion pathway protein C